MTTLKKFECRSARVIIRMHDVVKERVPALYSVQETPKKKNAGWQESIKYFDFSREAKAYFMELVNFWCE